MTILRGPNNNSIEQGQFRKKTNFRCKSSFGANAVLLGVYKYEVKRQGLEGKGRGGVYCSSETLAKWELQPCPEMERLQLMLSLLTLSYLVYSQQLLSTTWHILIGLCSTKFPVTVAAQCLYSLFFQSPNVFT